MESQVNGGSGVHVEGKVTVEWFEAFLRNWSKEPTRITIDKSFPSLLEVLICSIDVRSEEAKSLAKV